MQSILAKAFRGELVPQDPTDEPASVLFECARRKKANLQPRRKSKMSKPDISTTTLPPWDTYKNKQPDDALASIYTDIEATSLQMRTWYWTSIRSKRKISLAVRGATVVLLIFGTILPIFAAIQVEAKDKLLFTQWAVSLLAIAGLMQVADRVFGWSSGWMRYITTVTTMENLTRVFQLEWAKYLVSKVGSLDPSDVKALFDLALRLEQELTKLQADETTQWVNEFNTGTTFLETLIKTQREETDKKLEAIRTSLTTQEASAKAEGKAKLPGALEVTIVHKGEPKKIKIALDDEAPVEFLGYVWSRLEVPVGQHLLRVLTTSEPPRSIQRITEIKPESITKEQISLGEESKP